MSKAEDFVRKNTRHCSNIEYMPGIFKPSYFPWLTPGQARRAVEIAREEELEYTKYQLELKLPETLDYNGIQVDREDFINDFIKAMKDE